MRTGGMKRSIIWIIWGVLAVLMAVGVFFAVVQPDQKTLQDTQDQTVQYNTKAATKPAAQKAVQVAQIKQAATRIALLKYENKYMRIGPQQAFLSMKDPQAAMILLWKEQANILGPLITGFLRKSGLRVLTPIQIPGAPVDPNMINPNLYQVPLGQIQVQGSFSQINNFLRSLRSASRLIQVNNVELAGESPNVTATIDMTVLILPRDSTSYKAVPLATGDASAGGGGASGPYGPAGPTGGGYSPPPGSNGPTGGAAGGSNGG